MIIENLDGLTVIYAEGTNKITNKDRTFFTDIIYLGINDVVENYSEISREIWKHFITEDNPDINELKARTVDLNEKMENSNTSICTLEEVSLDTDFRLMCIEMQLEFGGLSLIREISLFSTSENNTIEREVSIVYSLLKKRIERQTYASKEEMQVMLDLYYFNNRITADQYDELTKLLLEQEKQ